MSTSFLQIASWNVENLSGASRASRKQSVYALTDHIEMAGVDIIAFQEIYVTKSDEEVRLFPNQPEVKSRADGDRRNRDLDAVCYLLEEHLDDPWRYRILPNRKAGDKSQLCAVMWNTRRASLTQVVPLNVPHKVDGMALWDRAPHAVNFTSELDVWRKNEDGEWEQVLEKRTLTLVPLHMKSNYGGVTENRIKRAYEAEVLCEALEAQEDELDSSLILIGDTNILRNDEPAVETFVRKGFVDLNNNDGSTYWSAQYGESPFDRAFVAKGREEFKYSRQYVLRSSDLQQHDRFLSDHYMIKISVKIYLDDNDPRAAVN